MTTTGERCKHCDRLRSHHTPQCPPGSLGVLNTGTEYEPATPSGAEPTCPECGMPWSRHNAGALVPVCDNRRATPSGAEPSNTPITVHPYGCRCGNCPGRPAAHDAVVVCLTTLEAKVAREALAAEATNTDWSDADHEVMEAVIAKLEALGVRGVL